MNYWSSRIISRRAALRSASLAGGGIVALSLAGCGGGSSKPRPSPGKASLDSTQGKPGGVLKYMLAGYPASLSPVGSIHHQGGLVYSSLLAHRWGQESIALDDYFNYEPDLAQAIPEQPDEVTYVFKLRPGAKFHNGRAVVAEDVKYSYDRYTTDERSIGRATWQAWYERIETPEPQTVVLKTKFPFGDTLSSTTGNRDGYILAREFEESPEATTRMMGSGPYVFVSAAAPVNFVFRKNPDYYLKPYPYFDEVQQFATTDVVKRIADFTSKQTHMPWLVYSEERDQIKQQRPDAKFQTYDVWSTGIFLDHRKPPFNDKRVRQGMSLAIDRKKVREATTKGEGQLDQFFNLMYKNVLGSREVKDLGDAAKYWEYNPAEAKKLMAAAGFDKPIESTISHYDGSVVGSWLPDTATISIANWRENGIAVVKDNPQLASQYTNTTSIGNYEGMGMGVSPGLGTQIPTFIQEIRDTWYWGPNGEHASRNRANTNDPRLSALAEKQYRQLKLEDRKATYREMEPLIADEQHVICYSTATQTWFWDPSIQNIRMSKEQGSRRYLMRWWFA